MMTRVHIRDATGRTWAESLALADEHLPVNAALRRRGYRHTNEIQRAAEAAARWVEAAPDDQIVLARSDPEIGQPLLALAELHDREATDD
jgi:hypothetical protein